MPLGLPVAGVAKFKGKEVQGFLATYDRNTCATTSCFDPFFEDPSILALWKFYTGNGPDGARAGYIAVGGSWTSKEQKVVSPQSFAFIPGVGLSLTDTQQSWSVFSVLNQPLWADPSSTDRFLNFRGLYSYTDGEANPIQWSATAALEMNGPFRRRNKDVFGVGYFHNELSNGFKNLVGPVLSVAATLKNRARTRINIEDTDGFEAYYKAQVTPWFAVTADLQVITETLSTEDTKVVAGVRGKVTF
jgi:porin